MPNYRYEQLYWQIKVDDEWVDVDLDFDNLAAHEHRPIFTLILKEDSV